MGTRNWREMLEARWAQGHFVCVGLDSEFEKIPECVRERNLHSMHGAMRDFNIAIVDATKDIVCAYKPNIAFYEAHGYIGLKALHDTIVYIHEQAPEVPVILDAKRGDIGNTNAGYAKMVFDEFGADAVTVHPYLGAEALKPFLDRADKGIIVLCRTSNPGAGEFQDRLIEPSLEEGKRWGIAENAIDYMHEIDEHWVVEKMPLYQLVAYCVAREWNKNNNCALVVGATYPEELAIVRRIVGYMPILIPGIGAQGGEVEKTIKAGKDSRGRGMIINSSRGIIFASSGPDFAEAARRETLKLHDLINQHRLVEHTSL